MTPNLKHILPHVLAALIVIAVIRYFFVEFRLNLETILATRASVDIWLIGLSAVPMLTGFVVVTQAWRTTLIALSGQTLGFLDGAVALNLPALAKYIPGKVWSYAIQAFWLSKRGFAKSTTVYVNLLTVACSLIAAGLLGSVYLVVSGDLLSPMAARLVFSAAVLGNIVFIWQERRIIAWAVAQLRRFTRREVAIVSTPRWTLIFLQAYHVAVYGFFGTSAYILSKGLGLQLGDLGIFSLTAILAVADAIGFLAFLVPGGLGVREGIMLSLMSTHGSGAAAVVLPIGTRVVMMACEALIAGLCLFYMKQFSDVDLKGLRKLASDE